MKKEFKLPEEVNVYKVKFSNGTRFCSKKVINVLHEHFGTRLILASSPKKAKLKLNNYYTRSLIIHSIELIEVSEEKIITGVRTKRNGS